MLFSTLALLIALPAAAYAAVCSDRGQTCDSLQECCPPYLCLVKIVGNQDFGVGPGTSESSLSLVDQNVRNAVYNERHVVIFV